MTSVRSFLAGTGASGSLLAAAFIASLAVTALLAFDGLPNGGDEAETQVVPLEQPDASTANAAVAGGTAVAAAGDAVASSPAPGSAVTDEALVAGAGVAPQGPLGPAAAPGDDPGLPGDDGTQTPDPTPRCADGSAPPCDPVDELIDQGDDTTDDSIGIRPGLNETTRPVRDTVDGVLQETTGNTLGGHIGNLLDGG